MSFFDSVSRCFNENFMFEGPTFRCAIVGDFAGYFENITSIKSYSSDMIIFKLKKGEVIIKGEDLYIKKYCEGDVAVCGKINAIERK